MRWLIFVTVVLLCVGAANAVIFTDDFNRADEELHWGADWEVGHGGKNWHLVNGSKVVKRGADPAGADDALCDVYVGALHAGEAYQRVSIDYMPRSDAYAPQIGVHLNFDGRNHYYFAENSYRRVGVSPQFGEGPCEIFHRSEW